MQTWRFYFFLCFGCGALWDSAEAAILRVDVLLVGVRSAFDADLATDALVLRLLVIADAPFFVMIDIFWDLYILA